MRCICLLLAHSDQVRARYQSQDGQGALSVPPPAGFAPIAIGLALTLSHLISIPVTNTSVNPARSTGPALFVGRRAVAQLWFFWVAPLVGGAAGGLIYRWLSEEPKGEVTGRASASRH